MATMGKVWEVKEVTGDYVANQHLRNPGWTLWQVYTKPRRSLFGEPESTDTIYVLGRSIPSDYEAAAYRKAMAKFGLGEPV